MIVAWLVGFGLYQWLAPQGPGWWSGLVGQTHPARDRLSASLPSFAVAFILASAAALLLRPRAALAKT